MAPMKHHNRPALPGLTGDEKFITPDWPAPANVRACVTTRLGGVSTPPWAGFNLAAHVGDNPDAVSKNRETLTEALSLPSPPRWLEQVHGNTAVEITDHTGIAHPDHALRAYPPCRGDAAIAKEAGPVCAVLTADCLPVLFCDRAGTGVAAAHAGWRGLAGGVLESAVAALDAAPEDLLAWLGPAIGPEAFEVGDEVREIFVRTRPEAALAFVPTTPGHWQADLYLLARQRLERLGLRAVYGGDFCTWRDSERFFSYRRDGVTGRMASLIWMEER
uniref:Purine nucleoside phosphorylase n=1 Tax=Candidatus Kentrum sp. DK TaxID=2126562 RepID=A0A450SCU8_9GAMM|nr:MAG: conserved hypothetical protein [Candidatus Kentron sp. DK]